MNIICIAKLLFGANFEILHYSCVFVRCQNLCKPESNFMQTGVDIFYCDNITSFLN